MRSTIFRINQFYPRAAQGAVHFWEPIGFIFQEVDGRMPIFFFALRLRPTAKMQEWRDGCTANRTTTPNCHQAGLQTDPKCTKTYPNWNLAPQPGPKFNQTVPKLLQTILGHFGDILGSAW